MAKKQTSLTRRVLEIPLDRISVDPTQPRTMMLKKQLHLLADDIRSRGLQQPITVREADEHDRYIIVTGERRYLACKAAGLSTITAIVGDATQHNDELQRLLDQVKENTLREPLNTIEIANTLRRLRDEHGVKVGELPELAKSAGIGDFSRSHISNLIRLTELPDWAQEKIAIGEWTFTHGKHLLTAVDVPDVIEHVEKAIAKAKPGTWDAEEYATADGVATCVENAFSDLYPDVSRVRNDEWTPEADRIYYDAKKYAAEDASLNLREISRGNGYARTYALNRELHEKLNAEAREKFQARQSKKQAQTDKRKKSKSTESSKGTAHDEAAVNILRCSDERVRENMHAWLREQIIAAKFFDSDRRIAEALVLWAAQEQHLPAMNDDDFATETVNLNRLMINYTTAQSIQPFADTVAHIVNHASLDICVLIADALHISLDDYRVTDEALGMFTTAGLDELAELTTAPDEIKSIKKAVDKRAALLQHAETIGMPPIFKEQYDEILKACRADLARQACDEEQSDAEAA